MATFEHSKIIRDHLLIESDIIVAELTDAQEISRWVHYRQLLRDFFIDKPENYDYIKIVWPKTPRDIDALKQKAAEGDAEAIAILAKETANGTLY
jgi:predicted nucleic acid-binding protein